MEKLTSDFILDIFYQNRPFKAWEMDIFTYHRTLKMISAQAASLYAPDAESGKRLLGVDVSIVDDPEINADNPGIRLDFGIIEKPKLIIR
ncbi:MAG: hypothetical protein ABFD63_04120 [Smithella sp.]